MKLIFDIYMPDYPVAGLLGFTERITIEVESGDPGGDNGEFAGFMRTAVEDWYDGAQVILVDVAGLDS